MTKANTLTNAASVISDALAQARADLDELRDRIEDLRSERDDVVKAPCDRTEAKRRIDRLIETAQDKDLFYRPELFGAEERWLDPMFNRTLADRPLEVLATLVPEQLAAALLAHHPGGGHMSEAREARLEELDRDLQAAEVAEEIAAREYEQAGGTILRRLEADPSILLAPDAELGRDDG